MKKCECCGQEIIARTTQEIPAQKLEWGKVSGEVMNWNSAKIWCESQGEGWRLPTRIELLQAYEDKIEGFKDDYFWSSSESDNNTAIAWIVSLGYGYTNGNTKITTYYVRCVRS